MHPFQIRKEINDQEGMADIYDSFAEYFQKHYKFKKACFFYKKANKIRETLALDDNKAEEYKAYFSNRLGLLHFQMGAYEESKNYFDDYSYLKNDSNAIAVYCNNIASIYSGEFNFDEAENKYNDSIEIINKHFGENHLLIGYLFNNLGFHFEMKGNYDKALDYYKKSIRIKRLKIGDDHPDTLISYINKAHIHYKQNYYDDAEDLLVKKEAILNKNFGKNLHPLIVDIMINRSLISIEKGDYDNALELFTKALEIVENQTENDVDTNPKVSEILYNIGRIYQKTNMLKEAESYYLKSEKLLKNINEMMHIDLVIRLYNSLSLLYAEKGDFLTASKYCMEALQKMGDIYHPYKIVLLHRAAHNFIGLKKIDKADQYVNKMNHLLEMHEEHPEYRYFKNEYIEFKKILEERE